MNMDNKFLNKYEQKSEFKPPEEIKQKSQKLQGQGEKQPLNRKLIIGVAGGALAAVIIGVILFLVLTSKPELPNMVGWKESDVSLWATENSVMLRCTEDFNDEIAAGLVIEHSPGEGEIVEKGNFLEVVISLGPDPSIMVVIPDFMEMSQSEIEAWEAENHMSKVRITSQNSKTVEVGKVISYTVNDTSVVGAEARRDSPIYIIISNGSGNNGNVTLPDFTLMTKEQAITFAEDNGIEIEFEEVFDEAMPKEQIISQDIDMEEVIKEGDKVVLKISLGPEIIIPNFSSYSADMAMTVASQNGIMTTIEEKYSSSEAGKLISQSIKSGSLYDGEEILILKYSLGNKVLIPSYIGQGKEAFEAWVSEYNALGTNIKVSVTYTTSNDLPGTIITQDKADTMSGISTTVNLVVSKGKVVYVPDFVADSGSGYDQAITREAAIAMCEEAGLIAVFKEESKSGRLEGEVWSQSVEAGKEVQQGTTITLKYTPVKSTIKVPNLVGMTVEDIIKAGHHTSFCLDYDLSMTDAGTSAKVLAQSVTAGTTVAPGTTITLTLDMGMDTIDINTTE